MMKTLKKNIGEVALQFRLTRNVGSFPPQMLFSQCLCPKSIFKRHFAEILLCNIYILFYYKI